MQNSAPGPGQRSQLRGRTSESAVLDGLISAIRRGESRALVIRGEAGIERVRKRTVETRDQLTAQERQIAHMAGDGLSNAEIGTRLFVSPRTVEWHLRKVFSKVGIHSRRELAGALRSSESEALIA
jgi:DNA-binding CsgD family transcriptional regulator